MLHFRNRAPKKAHCRLRNGASAPNTHQAIAPWEPPLNVGRVRQLATTLARTIKGHGTNESVVWSLFPYQKIKNVLINYADVQSRDKTKNTQLLCVLITANLLKSPCAEYSSSRALRVHFQVRISLQLNIQERKRDQAVDTFRQILLRLMPSSPILQWFRMLQKPRRIETLYGTFSLFCTGRKGTLEVFLKK